MKRITPLFLSLILFLSTVCSFAEEVPPAPPNGNDVRQPFSGGDHMGPPPQGERPGDPPDGFGGGGMGQPPQWDGFGAPPEGMRTAPDAYSAVHSFVSDAAIDKETLVSSGKDENAILVTDGELRIAESSVFRSSPDSSGGDGASFYGIGAAVLTTGGTIRIENSSIETDAAGGAGVFAYGEGTAYVTDCTITTKQGASGGIHVAGGGTLYATDLKVTTNGGSAAAIRSDRGGGTMIVNGGTYTSNGSGSPAVYVTADITISDADLIASGSEALCLEGMNSVKLTDCHLTGNMPDLDQNDNTWTVILYQSMSGDAQIGEGSFYMKGGSLTSANGGVFYTTNTDSVFTVENVKINACKDSEYFLRCTGNSNARGWGQAGNNGANCTFNAVSQELQGKVIYDSISDLTLNLTKGSVLTGAIKDDESCAGEGGDGSCTVVIDASSAWIVTEDSQVSSLYTATPPTDTEGRIVTVIGRDGYVYQQGTGLRTVTVVSYQVID